jgi:hypothetical protein
MRMPTVPHPDVTAPAETPYLEVTAPALVAELIDLCDEIQEED